MAEISATITDQTPLTAVNAVPPHRASARKLVSRLRQHQHGHSEIDEDHHDQREDGHQDAGTLLTYAGRDAPRPGRTQPAVVARSRTSGSSAAASAATRASP
jgi:hypothetical protein